MNQINEIPAFVKEHRTLLDAYVKLSSTVGARVDYVQGEFVGPAGPVMNFDFG